LYEIIKDKQAIARHKNHETKTNVPKKFTVRGRTESSVREQLETVGLESDGVIKSTMGGKKRNRYVIHRLLAICHLYVICSCDQYMCSNSSLRTTDLSQELERRRH
jgi:molybdopterin-biosynthesis enzyme MoeA-like protein